jgi:hypothetical protein
MEVDPELEADLFEKLGVPLDEQKKTCECRGRCGV